MTEYAATPAEAKSRGDKYYYTGKPCKRKHYAVRFSSNGMCSQCVFEHNQNLYWSNPEIGRERVRQWRQDNPEKALAAKRPSSRAYSYRYYWQHRDFILEKQKKERIEYPEYSRSIRRNWYQRNRDYCLERMCLRRMDNPDIFRVYDRRRRARKRGNGQAMTISEEHEWASSQPKVCVYCGVDCAENFHIDHIIPLAKGGPHQAQNLAISCPFCNRSKGAKDLDDFLKCLQERLAQPAIHQGASHE